MRVRAEAQPLPRAPPPLPRSGLKPTIASRANPRVAPSVISRAEIAGVPVVMMDPGSEVVEIFNRLADHVMNDSPSEHPVPTPMMDREFDQFVKETLGGAG